MTPLPDDQDEIVAPLHRYTGALSLGLFGLTVALIAVAGVVSGDATMTSLFCIALTLVASAVLPWGPQRQLAASVAAALAIVANAYLLDAIGYPTLTAVVAIAASVYVARQLDWQRQAERRARDELAEREHFLRLITNGLPALVAYIDADRRCRFANRAFEDWFGLPRSLMNGEAIEEFLVPEALAQLNPHIDAALAGREVSFEAVFTDRYGHARTFAVTYVPHTTETGAVRGFFTLASDITDRKQVEEAARQHQAQLAHALRVGTMGEMAAALAHELNQPLTAIATYASSCLHGLSRNGDEVRAQLEQIAAEAARGGEVLRRVQDFARRREPRWEPVSINHLVEEATRLVESEAHQLRIHMRLRLAPNLPLVEADSIQIEQVLINLFLNAFQAIDASRNGARTVEIETSARSGDEIEIAVRDSGVGLSAGIATKIFEPYFTTRSDGLGLGLSISRSIIDAHGGRLWASANPPPARGGSTFRFSLPANRVPEHAEA